MVIPDMSRSTQRGMYHAVLLKMCMTAGTSVNLTMNASIRIATPSPKPNSLMARSSSRVGPQKTRYDAPSLARRRILACR